LAVVTHFIGGCHCGKVTMVEGHCLVKSLGLTFEFKGGFLLANEKMKQKKSFLAYIRLQKRYKRTANGHL